MKLQIDAREWIISRMAVLIAMLALVPVLLSAFARPVQADASLFASVSEPNGVAFRPARGYLSLPLSTVTVHGRWSPSTAQAPRQGFPYSRIRSTAQQRTTSRSPRQGYRRGRRIASTLCSATTFMKARARRWSSPRLLLSPFRQRATSLMPIPGSPLTR